VNRAEQPKPIGTFFDMNNEESGRGRGWHLASGGRTMSARWSGAPSPGSALWKLLSDSR
jgi:hypothetical protein